MKRQWLAYLIVGVLSVGVGVAIAGLPDDVPVDATITPPSTTEAPDPTLPEPSEASTTTTTTPPSTTTTLPPTTTAPPPDTTLPPEVVLPARNELRTAVANGANVAGAATRFATLLEGFGYVNVPALNGTTISEVTVVFHAEGLELVAARLAEDLLVPPTAIAPLAAAPVVNGLALDTQLLAYIGRDIA